MIKLNDLIDDYIDKYFVIYILDEKYNAQFYFEDNQLKIRLLDLVDRDTMLKLKKGFNLVNGIIDKKDITIFNFHSCGMTSGMDEKFELRFRFDEFIKNHKYTNKNNRKIRSALIEFYNINDFTNIPFYDYDEHLNPIFKGNCYSYNFVDKKISILVGNSIINGHSLYQNEKTIFIEFKYNKSQRYVDVIRDIYHFKAFLSILSKREIGIKKIKVNENNIMFLNCIKFVDRTPNNEWLAHHYNEFVITIEKIDKYFLKAYVNFNTLLENALPIFDIYLDILKYKTSDLNRFLNYTQILEYISKNYDEQNANNMWIKNGKPSGRITLSDRIESILNQVAYIWKFNCKKVHKLSRKIADGRNYYNHHTNESKKLSDDELFRISYFLEDVMLAYIYQYIGVDNTIVKSSLNYNIYYDKSI